MTPARRAWDGRGPATRRGRVEKRRRRASGRGLGEEKAMNVWKISTVVLGVALGTVLTLDLRAPQPASAQDQPHMHWAYRDLEKAHRQLGEAAHDKNGHRFIAWQLVGLALEQTEWGIKAGEFNEEHHEK
jgi:hypothetical protein